MKIAKIPSPLLTENIFIENKSFFFKIDRLTSPSVYFRINEGHETNYEYVLKMRKEKSNTNKTKFFFSFKHTIVGCQALGAHIVLREMVCYVLVFC